MCNYASRKCWYDLWDAKNKDNYLRGELIQSPNYDCLWKTYVNLFALIYTINQKLRLRSVPNTEVTVLSTSQRCAGKYIYQRVMKFWNYFKNSQTHLLKHFKINKMSSGPYISKNAFRAKEQGKKYINWKSKK